MPSFSLHSFGCRANQAEGAALTAELTRRGWTPAAEEGDWAVLNTCTVTAEADAEARRAIRRLRRERPRMRIAVTGCYAQRAPAEVAALPGVDAVVSWARQGEMAAALADISSGLPKLLTANVFERTLAAALPAASAPDQTLAHTRAIVKVQDGCSRRCSYCVIPMVRGAHRSLPLGGVLEQIRNLAEAGVLEAVVSGINLGQWGRDLDRRLGLPDLVRAILEQTPLPRLRLSSIEPMDWDARLTHLLATEPRLAPHAHLPLQSGSDAVLRRMRRRYTGAQYAERVLELRRAAPEAAIGADVMVGFPGETEAEFDETRRLVAAMPFTYLHIFTFSSRAGTEAAARLAAGEWKPVPAAIAAARGRELRQLMAEKRAAFLRSLIGRRLQVLTLRRGGAAGGGWGLSGNFIEVELDEPAASNQLFTVEITGADRGHLLGHRAPTT